jgi:predicted nucleic acid-binding protein
LLILDTDIASAFAKAGHFEVLIQLFGKVGITPMVYEELQTPLMHGYAYPDEIFNKAELVTVSSEEQKDYLKLNEEHSKIGKGEVESMVVCRKRGFLFSSFDKKAISIAKESGVNVITAGAIFHGFLIKGIATKEEVMKILRDIEISDNRLLEMEL